MMENRPLLSIAKIISAKKLRETGAPGADSMGSLGTANAEGQKQAPVARAKTNTECNRLGNQIAESRCQEVNCGRG